MGVETQIRLGSGQATLKHYCKDCCKRQKLIVMLAEPQGLGREFAFLGGVDKTRGQDAGESGVPRNGPHLEASYGSAPRCAEDEREKGPGISLIY